ncbi:MAG: ASCH domain-containing protein [Tenacibaculum sp.]|nr:ASCH domain-containing protein [Tenacibaculum sp.]
MKTLHLTIKKQWFDLIKLGKKKEEYREIKPYWSKRLLEDSGNDVTELELCEALKYAYHPSWDNEIIDTAVKDYYVIIFKNGYRKNAPTLKVEYKGLKISRGKTEWGAEEGVAYFTLLLGKIL